MHQIFICMIFALLSVNETNCSCLSVEVLKEDCFLNGVIECSDTVLELFIYEDCPAGMPIANFTDPSVVVNDCRGFIEPQSDGSFSLAEPLDSEDPLQINQQYCLDFVSSGAEINGGSFTIVDVNEFPPQPLDISFQKSLRLYENVTGEVLIFSYIDNDLDEYKNLTFEENFGEDSPFSLEQKRIDDTDDKVVYALNVLEGLDYERIQFYALEVIFTSCDVRGNCSNATQNFLISVDDVGDQPPTFINSSPFVDFDEGPSDRFVFTMIAIDGDLSVSNEISYDIVDGNDDGYFAINSSTGDVTSMKEIDREILDLTFFALTIRALEIDENGAPAVEPNSVTQKLDINIIDLNDNEPTFDRHKYSVSTPEPDSSVAEKQILEGLVVVVVDMDEGYSGRYTITTDNANVKVSPEVGTGETNLTVSILPCPEFDYETSGDTAVIVMLTAIEDDWPFRHRATAQLEIVVEDVNDNYPQFPTSEYNADALETLDSGTQILKVTATDGDGSPEFSEESLVYSIENCESIEIEEDTGIVLLRRGYSLDYETSKELECTITVEDMFGESESSLQAQTSLFIHVQDVNDELPVFTSIKTETSIPENSEIGSSVTSFTVEDVDTTSKLQISLAFENAEVESWFEVSFDEETNSGTVVTANLLDREIESLVIMEVTVTDKNNEVEGMGSTSELVYITIEDTNDEDPYFVEDYSTMNVTEESPADSKVFQVVAEDEDQGDYVTYGISDNPYLYVDASTGWVKVLSRIDREQVDWFQVQLVATDTGEHTDTVTVNVSVVDISDNEPYYADDTIFGDFLPTSIQGDSVATFQFEDADVDDVLFFEHNNDFSWNSGIDLIEPFSVNSIDARSGEITLNVEATGITGYCLFTITATDQGGFSETVPVQINSISEDNIVDFLFGNAVETVRVQQNEIEVVFTDAFGYECITDYIDTAKDVSNSAINGYTLYQAHFLDLDTQEIVPKENIERQGSDGNVVAELNTNLYPLTLKCIGACASQAWSTNKNVERNLKISFGVVTLTLIIIMLLMLLLFIKKSTSLKLELKAMSVAAEKNTKQEKNQPYVPGSNRFIAEGTNPIWNVDSEDLLFQSDSESIASGGSILVGVEEDPTFLASIPSPEPITFHRRCLSVCSEESA